MNKTLISVIIIVLLVGGGAFYGGMKYAENQSPRGQFLRADFQNLSAQERQQMSERFGANMGVGFRGSRAGQGGGLAAGEVIAKDGQSITIKLPDSGSRIVFFSTSTEISKTVEGTMADIGIGKQIMAQGKENPDGSLTAQTIQLRSVLPLPVNSNK